MAAWPFGWVPGLGVLIAALTIASAQDHHSKCDHHAGDIYEFEYKDLMHGRTHSMREYSGKVLLLVNVATYWGLTISNYYPLNDLQKTYDNFLIIGFPCNQFGLQEPGGTPDEIMNGIKYCRPGNGFIPNFAFSEKVDVAGESAIPLFKHLTDVCPEPQKLFEPKNRLNYTGLQSSDIRWNFEKFLIGKDGIPAYRFEAKYPPEMMDYYIEKLL